MTEIAVVQNTPEWHDIRRGPWGIRIGASEVGTVCGINPYTAPFSLYDKITNRLDGKPQPETDTPEACIHGHRAEPFIADMYATFTGKRIREGGFFEHTDPELSAAFGCSPDRLVLDKKTGEAKGLVEIKAPFYRMHDDIKPYYMAQVQYQLYITGLSWCDFVVVKLNQNTPHATPPRDVRARVWRVYRNEKYINDWMLPRLRFFVAALINRQRPHPDLFKTENLGLAPPPKVVVEEKPAQAWRVVSTADSEDLDAATVTPTAPGDMHLHALQAVCAARGIKTENKSKGELVDALGKV
jgi:exodeoxyribonuclease (lambda-induced)